VVERSPEKAGVGGSTPSLATILFNSFAGLRLIAWVRSRSVFVGSATQNGLKHRPLRLHAVFADAVRIQLQGGLNVRMPEQSLNRLGVSLGPHQERCQRMPEVVKAETKSIGLRQHSGLDRCRSDVILYQHVCGSRRPAPQL
jgi:hypothetical protein